jgi:leucine dehydrogenase
MTYKAAVADIPLGGGKGVIMVPPHVRLPAARRHAALLDFADTVEALDGAYITAEDVGTSSRDMTVIAEQTAHVRGLARGQGGSGDPSSFTALGLEYAIRACCERVFGSESLRGRSVCVLGAGHVGSRLARRCARAGAKLALADVDGRKRRLADELGATWTTPERALEAGVDVLAPCALGGVLSEETVPLLRCKVIAGAANNQLADDRVADLLSARGILWAPDFVANAGGVISIAEEPRFGRKPRFGQEGHAAEERGAAQKTSVARKPGVARKPRAAQEPGAAGEPRAYDAATARRRVREIADTLRRIFDDSDSIGATPLTAAMQLARKRLVPPTPPDERGRV